MSDLSIMSQATQNFQQMQAQPRLSIDDKPQQNNENNFAALTAKQLKDPSFTKAMQQRKIRETAVDFEAQF